MLKNKILAILLVLISLTVTGCFDARGFDKNKIKNQFCGVNINYQYCKCAFHNDFCEDIDMDKSEAREHVYDEYEAWINGGLETDCAEKNGALIGNSCYLCEQNETVIDNECVSDTETEESSEEENNEDEDNEEEESSEGNECKYDSDCDSICESNTMWKMGCNARSNTCEKTFDTDCSNQNSTFGSLQFPQVCQAGACLEDLNSINQKRTDLETEQTEWSNELKEINAHREDLTALMLDANKNCLNGLADMTNLAIIEFASRVGSVIAGGAPDAASAAVDYAGDALNKLYAYANGTTPPEEQKLKPHEYIKLNCDLYDYFIEDLASTDILVDEALEGAKISKEQLDMLP